MAYNKSVCRVSATEIGSAGSGRASGKAVDERGAALTPARPQFGKQQLAVFGAFFYEHWERLHSDHVYGGVQIPLGGPFPMTANVRRGP